ncbi:MAG: DUF192 domain-containing protein [Alphaproteobacteria bacterium]|nr:DUF192 domain-containing protein [Alphaproteobacteria bacterium]
MKFPKMSRVSGLILLAFALVLGVGMASMGHSWAVEELPRTGQPEPMSAEVFPQDQIAILKADGQKLYFDVELAITPRQLAYGLMNRTSMVDNAGMLFIFNSVDKRNFWMKDTLIPLDMLFISSDGEIHHIHHKAQPQDLTAITAHYPVKAVLELKGGAAEAMGLKEGDRVLYKIFRNEHLGQ